MFGQTDVDVTARANEEGEEGRHSHADNAEDFSLLFMTSRRGGGGIDEGSRHLRYGKGATAHSLKIDCLNKYLTNTGRTKA